MNGDMSGRAVLVSGATGGIGLITARELSRRGAQVVVMGRDPQKTERVVAETGAAGSVVADLSELAQVRRAAAEYRERFGRLDVLVNNAGAIFEKRRETREGVEMTWALNHLAPFVLTHELLGLLRESPQARVVTVASAAHHFGRVRFDDPEFRQGYSSWGAYGQSKLANVLFARELARREPWLVSTSLHPGMVASGFGHTAQGGRLSRLYRVVDRFAISPEEGAQTSIFLASTPDAVISGAYYDKSRPAPMSPRAQDDGAAARLWTLSEEYAGLHAPTWPEVLREVRRLTGSEEG
jgi:NAD(P)-dependent dehydrogenase (short-subunit alcohol dehydrogenase family)